MTPAKVLVTGATGKTGGAVVDQLVARGVPVRAVIRSVDARSRRLERMGVETVFADPFDPEQLLEAMRGTQRAYYLPVFDTYMIQASAAFAVAAREAKLESIVQMGQWLSHRSHPAIMTRQTWLSDRLLARIPGVAHTILNPGMFADNFLRVMDFAALLGIFPVLTGEGRAAPVSNEDMARVAAAVLVDPAPHAGKSYRPTGPALLSGKEMAVEVARVLGRRVTAVNLPFWLFRKVARQQRVNPLEVSGFRFYVEEMKRGTFELGGGVTDVVRELTGTPAESFETTARRYAAMPFAKPTAGNKLRAFLSFNRTPFYVGYDLEKWDRDRGFPVPPAPSLSLDDPRWRSEHGVPAATEAPATSPRSSGPTRPGVAVLPS